MPSIAPICHTRQESSSDDWITPKWLIDRLGLFDLDPCASVTQPWPCARESYHELDNGLMREWHGLVWLNPPYGNETARWLNRLSLYGKGVALVFARTETEMFFDNVWRHASVLLFLKGRLTFCRPDGTEAPHNSGGPSVLIAYGNAAAGRLFNNADLGVIVVPARQGGNR